MTYHYTDTEEHPRLTIQEDPRRPGALRVVDQYGGVIWREER